MKFLITGITGFAGPHLANNLIEDGHEVHGLIRSTNCRETDILDVVPEKYFNKIKFNFGDILDMDTLKNIFIREQYDGCFHLAAQSHPPSSFDYPLLTFNINAVGTINIIESICKYSPNTKLMFCSTSEVYGNEGSEFQIITENTIISPVNPYGVSKAAADLYLQERMKNNKINAFITRAFSHTGPRRGKNFSISWDAYNLANIYISGRKEGVLDVGNLETFRCVIDVRDCVNAYKKLMLDESSTGNIYNICGDMGHKMQYFTDYLIEYSGLSITKKISSELYRPHDIFYQKADNSKIKEIGWSFNYSIEQTLEDLFEYWCKKLSK